MKEYRYTPLYRPLSSSSYDVLDLERAGKVRFVYDYSRHKYGLIVSPTPLDFGRLNDQYGELDSDGNLIPPLEEVEEEYIP